MIFLKAGQTLMECHWKKKTFQWYTANLQTFHFQYIQIGRFWLLKLTIIFNKLKIYIMNIAKVENVQLHITKTKILVFSNIQFCILRQVLENVDNNKCIVPSLFIEYKVPRYIIVKIWFFLYGEESYSETSNASHF